MISPSASSGCQVKPHEPSDQVLSVYKTPLSLPAADSAGGTVLSAASGLVTAGDLLSAPPGGHWRGQHRGQREGPRHRQQTVSAAATGGC